MTPPPPESISWLRLVLASSVVLGLMALLGFSLRYIKDKGLMMPGIARKTQRLQMVESLALDARRRLVIVRCDNREHLLLLGSNQDIVIEANLNPSPSTSASPL